MRVMPASHLSRPAYQFFISNHFRENCIWFSFFTFRVLDVSTSTSPKPTEHERISSTLGESLTPRRLIPISYKLFRSMKIPVKWEYNVFRINGCVKRRTPMDSHKALVRVTGSEFESTPPVLLFMNSYHHTIVRVFWSLYKHGWIASLNPEKPCI